MKDVKERMIYELTNQERLALVRQAALKDAAGKHQVGESKAIKSFSAAEIEDLSKIQKNKKGPLKTPALIVFAGHAGSSHSQLIKSYASQGYLPELYIDKDQLAGEILAGFSFSQTTESQRGQAQEQGKKQAELLCAEALNKKVSFVLTTAIDTPGKLNFLRKAKQKGYHIYLEYFFSAAQSSQIKLAHPQDKVHLAAAENAKGSSLLPQALQIADQASIYANSLVEPILLLEKQKEQQINIVPLNNLADFSTTTLEALEKIKQNCLDIDEIFQAIEAASENFPLPRSSSLQVIYNAYAKNALKRGKPFLSYEVMGESGLMTSTDAHICLKLLKKEYSLEAIKNILQKSPVLVGQAESSKASKFLLAALQ